MVRCHGLAFLASASGSTPAEAQSLRLFAAVAAAADCVPRGQRALLDADMLELIDRSACLVELVTVESCAPPVLVLSPQQARPAPRPVAAREFHLREALWKVFCSLGCSLRAAPVASLQLLGLTEKSWMISSLKRDSTLLSFIVCLLAPLVIMLKTSSTLCAFLTLLTGLRVLNPFILHSETDVDDLSVHAL